MRGARNLFSFLVVVALSFGVCFGRFDRNLGNVGPIVQTEPKVLGVEGIDVDERTVQTAREVISHSGEMITWTNRPGFDRDVFTFARIIYSYAPNGSSPRISTTSSPWGWITDFPDSDLNLSFRVQQMTSIRTSPDGRALRLTSKELFDYPWIYIVEPGRMRLSDEEISILRKCQSTEVTRVSS